MPRPRFAASSLRSPPPCPASKSASCCRIWPGSWTSSCRSAPSSAAGTITPATSASPGISARTPRPEAGRTSARRRRACKGRWRPGVPPFVSLCYTTQHKPYNEPSAGFLGLGHNAFRPMGEGKDDLVLQGITADRLDDRRNLLAVGRSLPPPVGQLAGRWTAWTPSPSGRWASSPRRELFDALDVTKESQATRDRYGWYDPKRAIG